jgi:hypothetical protein
MAYMKLNYKGFLHISDGGGCGFNRRGAGRAAAPLGVHKDPVNQRPLNPSYGWKEGGRSLPRMAAFDGSV